MNTAENLPQSFYGGSMNTADMQHLSTHSAFIATKSIQQLALIALYALDQNNEQGFLSSAFTSTQDKRAVDQTKLFNDCVNSIKAAYSDHDKTVTILYHAAQGAKHFVESQTFIYSWFVTYVGIDAPTFEELREFTEEFLTILFGRGHYE